MAGKNGFRLFLAGLWYLSGYELCNHWQLPMQLYYGFIAGDVMKL
jgi:hypothetical protein